MPKARAVALLLVLALVLRLASNWWLTVPTPTLQADAFWYQLSAINLAAGRGYIHHFTMQPTAAWPPGYPFLLSVLYRAFGTNAAWGFLLNAIAGTITCWLTGRIAARVASDRAEVWATALMAVAPAQILFASLLLTETVFTMILTALVLWALHLLDDGRALPWMLWGAAVGVAGLVRAEAVLLVAAPLAVLVLDRARRPGVLAMLAFAAAGLVVAQSPWLVRNARIFGRVVPATTSFGRTLLIGHNPVADGGMNLWSPDAAADRRDLALGGPAHELAVDARLRDAGIRFALENPGAEVRLFFQRLWRMYRGDRVWNEWYFEPSAAGGIGSGQATSAASVGPRTVEWLGRASNAFYWMLMLLAVPAFARLATGATGGRLIAFVVLVWTLFYAVVLYGSERFHFPLVPLFCVFAAATIEQIGNRARRA